MARGIVGLLCACALVVGVRGWLDAATGTASATAMAREARTFLAALTPEQQQMARFAFDDEQRYEWYFVPRARKGVPLKVLSPKARELAHAFMRTGLSARGYKKASAIIALEEVLRELEQDRTGRRDPELYYFSIFGEPSPNRPWGWRVEGHHLSLNFTIDSRGLVATAPAFMGSNPAEVRTGPQKGLRILGSEEDLARTLVEMLDPGQRKTAIISPDAPDDIVTSNERRVSPLEPVGLRASQMTPAQQKQLRALIDEYLGRMPDDLAARRRAGVTGSDFGQVLFAWAGSTARGERHYYRVQGPTFLIEYDNTQNDANHVHTVWRDFAGDWGADLLSEHYEHSPHHRHDRRARPTPELAGPR